MTRCVRSRTVLIPLMESRTLLVEPSFREGLEKDEGPKSQITLITMTVPIGNGIFQSRFPLPVIPESPDMNKILLSQIWSAGDSCERIEKYRKFTKYEKKKAKLYFGNDHSIFASSRRV